jgi:hypothetical protein
VHDLFENPIKMSQGLEANFISDLTDPEPWIEKEVAGLLDARAGDEFGEMDSGGLMKHLAKIIGAHEHRRRDL